jgi:hypothetical protein
MVPSVWLVGKVVTRCVTKVRLAQARIAEPARDAGVEQASYAGI